MYHVIGGHIFNYGTEVSVDLHIIYNTRLKGRGDCLLFLGFLFVTVHLFLFLFVFFLCVRVFSHLYVCVYLE